MSIMQIYRYEHWRLAVCLMMGVIFSCLTGCSDDADEHLNDNDITWVTCKIAIVLPMNNGLDAHWERTMALYALNAKRAFKNQSEGIELQFEWYDENVADLGETAKKLSGREDIVAVIGGLYSANAKILATELVKKEKPFFTLATTEELVRGYAQSGNLWAMTETDITQCEVLLSKAAAYNAKSVSLIANGEDLYGKTFVDWFAFQAQELGLKVKGVFPYTDEDIVDQCQRAAGSGADYLICAPSKIASMATVIETVNKQALETGIAPCMLFSDIGYGSDVIARLGPLCEGIEGVCFGADPESGFEVSYEVYYGEQATRGEAQVYDAAMLIGYALYYQTLYPNLSFKEAMRQIVDGRDSNEGSWMGEDMRMVIDALKRGDHPDVSGASGTLNFDSKVYTNVLNTTYYNYLVYQGRFIILDYNTSDGSKRSETTLAGWNWKARKIQDFEDEDVPGKTYPNLDEKWALLVAGSSGWVNYRHQADVLNMYQILRSQGYDDSHIVLIVEDDIAMNESNPNTGVIQVRIGGSNVYENIKIDYHTSQLQPEDIKRILCGEKSERLPEVIGADADDNVLVFWSGHGGYGQFNWLDKRSGFTTNLAKETFRSAHDGGHFRKMLWLIETCYSGSVAEACEGIPGILCFTAANSNETSKADIYNTDLGVWMSNRFTSTLQDCLSGKSNITLRELYYRMFINTVGSHVMVYNIEYFGNLYVDTMQEFL